MQTEVIHNREKQSVKHDLLAQQECYQACPVQLALH